MGKEDFIRDALEQPRDYVAYHVGRKLAKLHPDKTIIEGEDWSFDLEDYVRAEKCAVVEETSFFPQTRVQREDSEKKLSERYLNVWLNVLWRGQLFDLLYITYTEGCYRTRHHWIIADDKKFAEDFFLEVCRWNTEVHGEVLVFHDGEWMKNKDLYESIKSSTHENLVLRDDLKKDIFDDFDRFFASRELYEQHGIPWKRGVLFTGPPGNGKTHTVKALINHLQKPCLYVKTFEVPSYQTAQEAMNLVFSRARQNAPCVLVFEDLDSMVTEENRSFFLNELDGFSANTGVVVLATTNYPEKLDPAIRDRPSRFDRKYNFDLPALSERSSYMTMWNRELEPRLQVSEQAWPAIVRNTEGFSFAYLKELFVASMMQWMTFAGAKSMDEVLLDQTKRLREQMAKKESGEEAKSVVKTRIWSRLLG
jgi:AAA+ superfamily predicted ATPase